jgi:hypothetical protein
MTARSITIAQRRLRPRRFLGIPRTRPQYLRNARWWELEARRGHGSAADSLRYARNMRLLAELAWLHGAGTCQELLAKSGARLEPTP